MRRLVRLMLLGAVAGALPVLKRTGDERNVRALARHVGCSVGTARRLYQLARRDGYGAAYARVFPGQGIPGIRPF